MSPQLICEDLHIVCYDLTNARTYRISIVGVVDMECLRDMHGRQGLCQGSYDVFVLTIPKNKGARGWLDSTAMFEISYIELPFTTRNAYAPAMVRRPTTVPCTKYLCHAKAVAESIAKGSSYTMFSGKPSHG
jgi:hypothetical protein